MFNKSTILGLIAASAFIASQVNAGDITGPNNHWDAVDARTADNYDIVFQGGRPAYVGISGDGDTDLDLQVFDRYGNEVCSSTSRYDDEACSFYPSRTSEYRVRVANLGRVYNEYQLVTN